MECKSESLRYHARNGQSVTLPLLHYNPNKGARVSAIALKSETTFTECNWCCRTFPKGDGAMLDLF